MTEERWFRVIEVASVLVIAATIVSLAVPKTGEMQRARVAQQMLADVEVVRKAVYRFYSDSAYFPAPVPGTQIPPGLQGYLPRDFNPRRPYGSFDYRNWPMAVRDTAVTKAPNVVGVSVRMHDPRVGAEAVARAHDTPRFVLDNRFTFLFFGT